MLRTAKDCLRIRDEKLKIFNKSQKEIKGQMKLIESKVVNANIDHETKYIDIGNVGKLFSENEKQIIKNGYYITQDEKMVQDFILIRKLIMIILIATKKLKKPLRIVMKDIVKH